MGEGCILLYSSMEESLAQQFHILFNEVPPRKGAGKGKG